MFSAHGYSHFRPQYQFPLPLDGVQSQERGLTRNSVRVCLLLHAATAAAAGPTISSSFPLCREVGRVFGIAFWCKWHNSHATSGLHSLQGSRSHDSVES